MTKWHPGAYQSMLRGRQVVTRRSKARTLHRHGDGTSRDGLSILEAECRVRHHRTASAAYLWNQIAGARKLPSTSPAGGAAMNLLVPTGRATVQSLVSANSLAAMHIQT